MRRAQPHQVSVPRPSRHLFLAVLLAWIHAGTCPATEISWIPAHHLAPQETSHRVWCGGLDGDLDDDISFVAPGVHYWNAGQPRSPVWIRDDSVFAGIPSCSFRAGALGDLDADGDHDLVITCDDRELRCYWNTGSCTEPVWEYDPSEFDGLLILEGGAEPYLVDLDANLDLDLVVVIAWDRLTLFRNVGIPSDPEWSYEGVIPNIIIAEAPHPTAALADLDGDGDVDAVAVTWDTPVQCWENAGTPEDFMFVENPEWVQNGALAPQGGRGIDFLDVDADGDLDLIVASMEGCNLLYLNEGFVPVAPLSWGRIKALYR